MEDLRGLDVALGRGPEVAKVALDTEVTRDNDSAVRVDVDLDRAQLRDPRPGATVIAKIDCGRRSLGYVWFRELIEFVESKILFRLG